MTPYRPDLSVRHAPRINRRFAEIADAVAARENMRKGDVLQYCFEAAVAGKLNGGGEVLGPLDAMLTVRTSRKVQKRVRDIWRSTPHATEADVLRGLLERGLAAAMKHRISYVMKLREAVV